MSEAKDVTRREFLVKTAAVGAGVTILPRQVLGRGFAAPSDRFNVAVVGVGGMGRTNLANLTSQNVVALCDVDWGYTLSKLDTDIANIEKRIESPKPAPNLTGAEAAADLLRAKTRLQSMLHLKKEVIPGAKHYADYREMLDKQKDIEGVVVATPDHMHAAIALAAMDLGKHVYVQKPLTWSVAEARLLSRRATETGLATQMGNQGRSLNDTRTAVEYVQSGAIGQVREVHVWTNRPVGFWPQGVPRPGVSKKNAGDSRTPAPGEVLPLWNPAGVNERLALAMAGEYPVPPTLGWDLFLGVGPSIPYHPIYQPFNWRGWVDWGVGAIGDMGAHLLDVSMWALQLGLPSSVETVSTPFNGASYPVATMTFYEFPARGAMPAVKLTWYDGGFLPQKPAEMGEEDLDKGGGALLVGSKGKLLHDTYGLNPRLLPKSVQEATGKPAEVLARVEKEEHELNWVNAAKGKGKASSPFEYAAQLTEVMLLGVVALHAGKRIEYDAANMRVTNVPEANAFLSRESRKGW